MRVCEMQPDIYYDNTIQGITWFIIGYGRQYFRHSLMTSAFTGNIIEANFSFPTSELGFLVNQFIMDIPIRVRIIPEKWES